MYPVLSTSTTMSSLEISELTGKNHADVLRDIRTVLADSEIGESKFAGTYIDSQNKERPCFKLPKRECDLVISGYSVKYRLAIIDRWQELEAKNTFNIPTTLSGALRLAAAQAELLEVQTQIIEQQKPAVQFVERYVESSGTKGFRDVCKLLKVKENRFREFLHIEKIMYRLDGNLTPYCNHIDAGRFEINAGLSETDHAYTQAKFTPKGINWVAGLYAVYNLKSDMDEAE